MTKRKAVNNIRKVMETATPDEHYYGTLWYRDALVTCKRLADEYNVPLANVAFAMAALSPNVRWLTNISATATLLEARRKGTLGETIVAGYPKNVQKAKRILEGDLNALSGQKVISFADNILYPEKRRAVTVDVHAFSIARGKRVTTGEMKAISKKMYTLISSAYTKVAEEYGILPHQCQAVCWIVWRRFIQEDGRGKRRSRL